MISCSGRLSLWSRNGGHPQIHMAQDLQKKSPVFPGSICHIFQRALLSLGWVMCSSVQELWPVSARVPRKQSLKKGLSADGFCGVYISRVTRMKEGMGKQGKMGSNARECLYFTMSREETQLVSWEVHPLGDVECLQIGCIEKLYLETVHQRKEKRLDCSILLLPVSCLPLITLPYG